MRIPAPYTSWTQVHTFPFGRVPFDLDISPDGSLLSASVGEVNGQQSVQVFRLAELAPDHLLELVECQRLFLHHSRLRSALTPPR